MEISFTPVADEPSSAQDISPLAEDLRRVLRTELLKGTCSANSIARLFSMHRRTMNRHLNAEGLAFRRVANQIRFEIACELLENTDMALGQVAAVLRYSEPSAFTRAFRRWSGQSPSAWRSSHPRVRTSRRLIKLRRLHPDPDGRTGRSNDLPVLK
jgi:AraC-like DNA-binding protein